MTEELDSIIQGLATAMPIIVTSLIVLYRFKSELCKQISDLKVEVETHLKLSEKQDEEFKSLKDRITNIILRNNLKY